MLNSVSYSEICSDIINQSSAIDLHQNPESYTELKSKYLAYFNNETFCVLYVAAILNYLSTLSMQECKTTNGKYDYSIESENANRLLKKLRIVSYGVDQLIAANASAEPIHLLRLERFITSLDLIRKCAEICSDSSFSLGKGYYYYQEMQRTYQSFLLDEPFYNDIAVVAKQLDTVPSASIIQSVQNNLWDYSCQIPEALVRYAYCLFAWGEPQKGAELLEKVNNLFYNVIALKIPLIWNEKITIEEADTRQSKLISHITLVQNTFIENEEDGREFRCYLTYFENEFVLKLEQGAMLEENSEQLELFNEKHAILSRKVSEIIKQNKAPDLLSVQEDLSQTLSFMLTVFEQGEKSFADCLKKGNLLLIFWLNYFKNATNISEKIACDKLYGISKVILDYMKPSASIACSSSTSSSNDIKFTRSETLKYKKQVQKIDKLINALMDIPCTVRNQQYEHCVKSTRIWFVKSPDLFRILSERIREVTKRPEKDGKARLQNVVLLRFLCDQSDPSSHEHLGSFYLFYTCLFNHFEDLIEDWHTLKDSTVRLENYKMLCDLMEIINYYLNNYQYLSARVKRIDNSLLESNNPLKMMQTGYSNLKQMLVFAKVNFSEVVAFYGNIKQAIVYSLDALKIIKSLPQGEERCKYTTAYTKCVDNNNKFTSSMRSIAMEDILAKCMTSSSVTSQSIFKIYDEYLRWDEFAHILIQCYLEKCSELSVDDQGLEKRYLLARFMVHFVQSYGLKGQELSFALLDYIAKTLCRFLNNSICQQYLDAPSLMGYIAVSYIEYLTLIAEKLNTVPSLEHESDNGKMFSQSAKTLLEITDIFTSVANSHFESGRFNNAQEAMQLSERGFALYQNNKERMLKYQINRIDIFNEQEKNIDETLKSIQDKLNSQSQPASSQDADATDHLTASMSNLSIEPEESPAVDNLVPMMSSLSIHAAEDYSFYKIKAHSLLLPIDVVVILRILRQRVGVWAMVAGGAIRDFLLYNGEVPPNDIDIVTNCKPNEIRALLTAYKIKDDPNMKEVLFHVSALVKVQIYCREFCSMVEDAPLRDFSMNAFYADENGIYDPLGVSKDIEDPCVNVIGDLKVRIKNDPKIWFRYIRYCIQTSKNIHPNDVECLKTINYFDNEKMSLGLYLYEIKKLFYTQNAHEHLRLMAKSGLLPRLFTNNESNGLLYTSRGLGFWHSRLYTLCRQKLAEPAVDILSVFLASEVYNKCIPVDKENANVFKIIDEVITRFINEMKIVNYATVIERQRFVNSLRNAIRREFDNLSSYIIRKRQHAAQSSRPSPVMLTHFIQSTTAKKSDPIRGQNSTDSNHLRKRR